VFPVLARRGRRGTSKRQNRNKLCLRSTCARRKVSKNLRICARLLWVVHGASPPLDDARLLLSVRMTLTSRSMLASTMTCSGRQALRSASIRGRVKTSDKLHSWLQPTWRPPPHIAFSSSRTPRIAITRFRL
jgi:hypothetical protein